MATSARLSRKTETALLRYCRTHRITKTEAIERGLGLLLSQERSAPHPAFTAFRELTLVPEAAWPEDQRSSDPMRAAVRAKHSD
jgi:hypothetical protein